MLHGFLDLWNTGRTRLGIIQVLVQTNAAAHKRLALSRWVSLPQYSTYLAIQLLVMKSPSWPSSSFEPVCMLGMALNMWCIDKPKYSVRKPGSALTQGILWAWAIKLSRPASLPQNKKVSLNWWIAKFSEHQNFLERLVKNTIPLELVLIL
jgi:hypothetical protein